MPEKHPYHNAILILERAYKTADEDYERLRERCIDNKDVAGWAQDKYDLGVELRHARTVLFNSKPSGILG